jgi:CHAT domain-containing protein/tetratricopeptide (TPR) repeat protein
MQTRKIHLYIKYLAVLVLTFVSCNLISAPFQADSVKFSHYFKIAESLKKAVKFKEAIHNYKKALGFTSRPSDVLITNRNISSLFYGLNELDSSRFWIDKNLKMEKSNLLPKEKIVEIARSYFILRGLYNRTGNYLEAINAIKKAIEVLEKNSIEEILLSSYYVDLGIGYWRIKEYESAKKNLNKAIELAKKINSKDTPITLQRSYMTLGLVYWNTSNFTKAIEHYKQVFYLLNKGDKNSDVNIRDYALNCSNIALVFNDMKLYDSSVHYQKKAIANIDLLTNSPTYSSDVDSRKTMFYNNLGAVLVNLMRDKEAEYYYFKAIESQKKQKLEMPPETAKIQLNLGNLYLNQGKTELAYNYFGKSISLRKKYFGENATELSIAFNAMGDLFAKSDNLKIASQYYDSAILSNQKISIHNNFVYADTKEIWYSFIGKIKILTSNKNPNIEQLGEIDRLYNDIKKQVNYAFTRITDSYLQSEIQKLLENLFDSYHDLYERTGNKTFVERLWEISEYKKSIKLNSVLNNSIALNSIIPAALQKEEKKIKDSLAFYTQQKFEEKQFNDSILFTIQTHYDRFIEGLESGYPEYYKLKYSLAETSLSKITASLTKEKVIVNFFETSKNLYSMILRSGSVQIQKNTTSSLDSLINLVNESIKLPTQDKDLNHKLTKRLVGKNLNLAGVKTIALIPDGIAWKIQFSLLTYLVDKPKIQLDFIGKNYNINYQYSYDYINLAEKINKKNNRKVLAFSYSNEPTPSNQNLSYLRFRDFDGDIPGASTEIHSISKTWDGDYYFSSQANESTFKKKCANYQILHLALHGLIDDVNPSYSRLKFYKSDSLNDGLLYSYEISGIPMNAELVVLSSCNSGAGKIQSGEGIESLGRAFSLAGVNSLLLSKWEVSDATAPIIMKYFYEGLRNGLTKSEALRLAKVQFLEIDADNITSSPYYWDSFYIMGDDKPLTSQFDLNKVLLIFAVGLILILGVWYASRLKVK